MWKSMLLSFVSLFVVRLNIEKVKTIRKNRPYFFVGLKNVSTFAKLCRIITFMKKLYIFIALLVFVSISHAQVKITNGGFVGIGTTNPQKKLHVVGDDCLLVESNTAKWGRSLWVKLEYPEACAYHLWSIPQDRDVFCVNEDGYLYTTKGGYFGSDERLKCNIEKIKKPIEKLMSINGKRYQYKIGNNDYRFGFIAQEVEKILPEVVKEMSDGTKAISYNDIIPINTEAIKEQQRTIEQLQNSVAKQQVEIRELQSYIIKQEQAFIEITNALKSDTSSVKEKISELDNNAKLYQNSPNPFSVDTKIRYSLPMAFNSAKIAIYNLYGTEIKSYNINNVDQYITIKATELSAGIYMYALLIDNIVVDVKRLVLTN